jgi:hypothetical protein
MKVSELKAALKPFSIVTSTPSLVPEYTRAVFYDKTMAVKTARATLWSKAPTQFDDPIEVEVKDIYGIVSSLPESEEFHIEVDDNKLRWECATVQGGLAFRPGRKELPAPPRLPKKMTPTDDKLGRMFSLGSAACSNVALQTIGLHGAAIYVEEDHMWCMSSDNISIAACRVDGIPISGMDETVYVGPKEAQLLATLCERKGNLAFVDNVFLYQDKDLTATVNLTVPLKHDLRNMLSRYTKSDDIIIPLVHDQIKAFIRRSTLLSELKSRVAVTIMVNKGKLTLIFSEDKAYSEEYYVAEGIPEHVQYEITLHVNKLSSSSNYTDAFGASDELIADLMEKKVMVIRSKTKDFYYVMGGHTG